MQVRLITLLLDTPMVSKQLKWQGHTSYAACAICGDIYGMSGNGGGSGGGSRRVGHRCYLDIKHFLRSWGQSEQCCPPGYYSNRVPDIELKASHECTVPLNICRDVKRICDNENLESVKSFMLDKNATWVWHHSDTEFHSEPKVLLNYLYYPHVDYRAQIEYKRVTYDLSSYNDKTDERPTGLNYKPWFLYLGYFRVEESLTWCVFHAKMGAGRHTLREFTNESLTDKKGPYKEYLKRVLCHPYLYNVEHENDGATDSTNKNNKNDNDNNNNKSKVTDRRTLEEFVREKNRTLTKEHGKNQPKYAKLPTDYLYRIPWKVSKPELKLMEVYVNSLHVPGGLSDKFQLHDILSRLGQLRGAEVINIVEDLLDYILIPSSMPIAYKQYYSMFSEDIREMGKPVIKDKNEIDRIFLKVVETISLHEGMFPIFFSDFTYHELIDIVKHIQYQGPQKAFSTFSGERANAVLKKFVRKGGRNSTKTVLNSYLHVEAYNTSKAYSVKLEDAEIPSGLCHNLRKLLIFHSKNDGSIDRYEYNPFIFTMRKRDEFQDILTDFEMANLLSTLLIEVEKQSTSKENAKSTSSLYFIYCQWLRKYPERGNISKIGLHDRFYRYVKESSDHNSFPIISEFLALRHKIQKSCYRTCLIYGTEFVSRGMIERIKDSEDFLRDMNDFRISWSTKKQYSSWCQYKTKFKQAFTGINDPEFGSDLSGKKFAQINGFFRVSLPSDSILNNIPIACVSDRKCKEFERVLRYEVDNQNIDGLSNLFIAATNIVPCRQLIAGFDSSNKPWKFRGNTGDDLHSHAKKCQIVYILCVPLDKKNDCIPYCIDHNCYYNFTEFDNYQ